MIRISVFLVLISSSSICKTNALTLHFLFFYFILGACHIYSLEKQLLWVLKTSADIRLCRVWQLYFITVMFLNLVQILSLGDVPGTPVCLNIRIVCIWMAPITTNLREPPPIGVSGQNRDKNCNARIPAGTWRERSRFCCLHQMPS